MELVNFRITDIQHVRSDNPIYADPNVIFNECFLDAQYFPCVENSNSQLSITNQGDASDIVMIAAQILGHQETPSVIPVDGSDTFHMDAGQTIQLTLTMHLSEEYWEETQNISIKFFVGWKISDTEMHVTDTITLDTQVYVEPTACEDYTTQAECQDADCYWWSDGTCHDTEENGNGVPCEGRSQSECTAPCHWYQKYFWEDEKCHSAEQNMLMDYLPFIIVGVGGAVIIAALVMRKPAPAHYPPPPPRYYPQPTHPQAY